MTRRLVLVLGVALFVGLTACGGDDGGDNNGNDTVGGGDTAVGADTTGEATPRIMDGDALGVCAGNDGADCYEFVGAYEQELASDTCDGADETFAWGGKACSTDGAVGNCLIVVIGEMKMLMYFYGDVTSSKAACDAVSGTWADL